MKSFFHYISYLQYPLLLIGLYFAFQPFIIGIGHFKENQDLSLQNLNSLLIFMGLAVSFSSLQDSARVQNKFLKRIWRHPIKGKVLIAIICIQILFLLSFGLFGYYFKKDVATKEIFIGVMVFGIGMFGYLKTAIEIFDHHRIDKNE